MSMLDGLTSTLAEMGFVQLALVFLAVGAYSIAINGAFGGTARTGAASTSFAAGVGFAALTPSWISGVVFLAATVLAVAAFAAAAWGLSILLGLSSERGLVIVPVEAEEERVPARATVLQTLRALVPRAIRLPL
jgi:hypothetical protein